MPTIHQVKAGDCVSSVAYEYGHFPDTLWDAPENAELKRKRKSGNTLCEGDSLFVPDKRLKEVAHPDQQRHRFRRCGVPEMLRLEFRVAGEPRANEAYTLEVDGRILSSGQKRTNAQGIMEHPIPPDAAVAIVRFGNGTEEYVFDLGELEPVTTVKGQQGRLRNLGFYDGPIDGEGREELRTAVAEFQVSRGLAVSGDVDEATRNRLEAEHGG